MVDVTRKDLYLDFPLMTKVGNEVEGLRAEVKDLKYAIKRFEDAIKELQSKTKGFWDIFKF